MRQGRTLHVGTQALGHRQRALDIGAGQDDGEFLAAITRHHVGRAENLALQDAGHALQARIAALVPIVVVIALEIVHIGQDQRNRLAVALRPAPFDLQLFIETAAVGQPGQAVDRRLLLQRQLCILVVGHVAQGLDHCDQLAIVGVDRPGIDGQIEALAYSRHDAPVLGLHAEAMRRRLGMEGVQATEIRRYILGQHIRQAQARFVVKRPPVIAGAHHFAGHDPGESLTGAIPDQHPAAGIQHEGRHDQMLHEVDSETQLLRWPRRLLNRHHTFLITLIDNTGIHTSTTIRRSAVHLETPATRRPCPIAYYTIDLTLNNDRQARRHRPTA